MDNLERTVFGFARLTARLKDAELEQPWEWGDYDEGVRFAFFRTLEDLNELAVHLAAQREQVQPPSTAQRFLAQHHAAFRDLQAILLGVTDSQAEQAPAAGEWPLRTALLHIVQAERAFFAITAYGLERERTQDNRPLALSDADWELFWQNHSLVQVDENSPFSDILAYYAQLHRMVLGELAAASEAELEAPVIFWESRPMPVRFRLGRFTSHLRQHSVQMEKALPPLGLAPNEAKRLLRLIFQALASVEGCLIGAPELASAGDSLAGQLDQRAGEVARALSESPAAGSEAVVE